VFRADITAGAFFSAVTLMSRISTPVTVLGGFMRVAIGNASSLQRLDEIVLCDKVRCRILMASKTLDRLSFQYDTTTSHFDLQQVSATFPLGHYVCIVGPSGCGKSTLLGCLMQFYEPSDGVIAVDDHNLHAYSKSSYMGQIAVVFQDGGILNGSILDNIRFGNALATDDECKHAAELAECGAFVHALKDGYDTIVGQHATANLSGGQTQRICLARALVRKPSILLLDEATSALDAETEASIVDCLHALAKKLHMTIISVTHRLSTTRSADSILVMQSGRIIDRGTYHELLARPMSFFAELVHKTTTTQRKNDTSFNAIPSFTIANHDEDDQGRNTEEALQLFTHRLRTRTFSDYVQGAQSQHDVAAKVYTYFDATTLYPNVLQICKQLSLDPNMTVQALVAQHLEGLAVPPKQATIPTQTISHAQYLQRGHVVHSIVHEIVSRHLLHDANPVVDLFSIDAFVARVSSLKDAFPPSWLHALAIKANPLSGILLAAKPLVWLETASIAEATHALNLGFAPRCVIVDSPCKTTDDLKALLQLGCYLNLDNVDEIHKVHSLLAGTVPDALLGLRINPVVGGGAIAASSTATATSKFGVPWTAATDADLIALYRDHAWLQGVHRAVAFAKQINQALGRHQIQVVDIGGGVPTVYNGMAEEAVEFADYAALLQVSVPELFSGEFRVMTEFGRSVFAKAGITLSRLSLVRTRETVAETLAFWGPTEPLSWS
ncbi:hypothetical protein B5M09_013001, partial [Aphanomyces astaci]